MFGEWMLRYRWLWMFTLLSALTGAAYLLPNVKIDQNFDNYFPDQDPDLAFYQYMTGELGDEDNLLSVAVYRETSIFDSVFLAQFHAFTLETGKLPYILGARSLTNLNEVRRTPFGNLSTPFIHLSNPERFSSDSLQLRKDPRLSGRLISPDFKTLAVILQLEPGIDGSRGEQLISDLERLGQQFGFEEMYITGRKYFEVSHNRVSRKEILKGFILCMALIIVILGFIYQTFWGILLPVLIYTFSILLFLAYGVLRGHSLDIMSSLAPTILLIVSVSDVIHFFSKYEDQIKCGQDKRTAIKATLNTIGLAIFLTSFTTAIGFLALLTSSLPTLRQFGEDIAIGVLLAFLVTLLFIPFSLWYIPGRVIRTRTDWYQWWHKRAHQIIQFIQKKRKWIFGSAVFLALFGAWGLTQMNTNHFFIGTLPKKHTSTEAALFFENNLGGVRTFEIALTPEEGVLLNDLNLLKQIEQLHAYVDSLPRTGGVYSPVTFYKSLNKAWFGGQTSAYKLPASQESLIQQEQQFQNFSSKIFHRILNKEKTFGKISARMNDPGRDNIYPLNEKVEHWINAHLDTTLFDARIIGASAMADKIQEHSIRNMFTGLAIALGAISLLIFLLYRKWQMVLIVLAINILPLMITGALMALSGIVLRCVTSVIFTIGFVIAVDDTIHFVGRYRLERLRGLSSEEAVAITLKETGRAMLLTSVILFFGFAQLTTSIFRDAQAVGALVSIMLFFALVVDLFLGPLLILKFMKRQ